MLVMGGSHSARGESPVNPAATVRARASLTHRSASRLGTADHPAPAHGWRGLVLVHGRRRTRRVGGTQVVPIRWVRRHLAIPHLVIWHGRLPGSPLAPSQSARRCDTGPADSNYGLPRGYHPI